MPITIGALKESAPGETRVSLVPEVVDKFTAAGARVVLESGAGVRAQFPDALYKKGEWAGSSAAILSQADVLLTVAPLSLEQIGQLKPGAVVVGFLQAHARHAEVKALRDRKITSFAVELIPRISRAQSMDGLSSQASLAGYKAVLIAANNLEKFMPMLTTAAGTIRPALALIIGAGVAGLQAIATARRLGAVVEAYDVRSATREQVKSLGAKFVETGRQRRRRGRLCARAHPRGKGEAAGGAGCAHRRRGHRDFHGFGAGTQGAGDHFEGRGGTHARRLGDRRHRRRTGRQLRAHQGRRNHRPPGREDHRPGQPARHASPTTPARCTRAISSTSSSPPSTRPAS